MLAYSISQNSNLPAAIGRGVAWYPQVENPRLYLPIVSANVFANCRKRAARERRRRMRSIHASTHALTEGSDLTGTEKRQRKAMAGRRVATSDDGASQVRNRGYHRGDRQARDRVEMIRASRLAGRSIRSRWRLAAVQLIHRSGLRAIRTARGHGTRARRRRGYAERKQQSDQKYGERAHAHTLLLASKAGNYSRDP